MLETWIKKTWKGLVEFDSRRFRWLGIFPPGIWITFIVVALVGSRLLSLNAHQPEHLKERVAAFGSVAWLMKEAQFNHDFSRFTYVTSMDTRGAGLFLCDKATGKKQLVNIEKDGRGHDSDEFDLSAWPWSPDGNSFTYSMNGSLFICPVYSNAATVELDLGTRAVPSDVIWLNPSEIVWLEGETLSHAKKTSIGRWTIQRFSFQGQITNLTAVDLHRIAWLQDNLICRLDLSQDTVGTNYPAISSSDVDALPLTNDLVLWLDASTLQLANGGQVTKLADLSPSMNSAFANQKPPTYNAPGSPSALNGKGTIHFSSASSITNASGLRTGRSLGITGNQSRTVFAVMRRIVGKSMVVGFGDGGNRGAYFGLCDQYDGLYLPAGVLMDNKMPAAPRTWNILSVIYDGYSQKGFVNGAEKGTTTFNLDTADLPVELGARTIEGDKQFRAAASDGDFAELLVYDRALSRLEHRQVETYLAEKWLGAKPLSLQSPLVWLNPGLDGVKAFSYSKETGEFLITCSNNDQSSLWWLKTSLGENTNSTQIMQSHILEGVQWIGARKFAYVGDQGLIMAELPEERSDLLLKHAKIGWLKAAPGQNKILFWGNVSNEPANGMWEYDLDSRQLSSIIPYSKYPSAFAKEINFSIGSIKLASGQSISYTVFPPANFDRRKKYPLVLGDTSIYNPFYKANMAACGAYVVMVNRPSWYVDIEKWEENVRAVYEHLKHDPCIDANRIYLLAISHETKYLSQCLEKTPGICKGAIFLDPIDLPDFSHSPTFQNRPKILISIGSVGADEDDLKKFQQDAMQSGVIVEFIMHPDENHLLVGTDAYLARLQAISHFINGE
jgi:hypothetical protein